MTDEPPLRIRLWADVAMHLDAAQFGMEMDAQPARASVEYVRADAVLAAEAEVARLKAELASGSFYQERDIDALMDERDALRAKLEAARAGLAALATELEGKAAPRVRPAYTYYDDDLESEIAMPETRTHALVRPSVYADKVRDALALLDAPTEGEVE